MNVTITLRELPGRWLAPADRRLARLLKAMKRAYGFEVTSIKPDKTKDTNERR